MHVKRLSMPPCQFRSIFALRLSGGNIKLQFDRKRIRDIPRGTPLDGMAPTRQLESLFTTILAFDLYPACTTKARNSFLVFSSVLKQPRTQLVAARAEDFGTLRITIHIWLASITTAARRGCRTSLIMLAIPLVSYF